MKALLSKGLSSRFLETRRYNATNLNTGCMCLSMASSADQVWSILSRVDYPDAHKFRCGDQITLSGRLALYSAISFSQVWTKRHTHPIFPHLFLRRIVQGKSLRYPHAIARVRASIALAPALFWGFRPDFSEAPTQYTSILLAIAPFARPALADTLSFLEPGYGLVGGTTMIDFASLTLKVAVHAILRHHRCGFCMCRALRLKGSIRPDAYWQIRLAVAVTVHFGEDAGLRAWQCF